MYCRLVIEGNAVYEIDDECERRRQAGGGCGCWGGPGSRADQKGGFGADSGGNPPR